MTTTPSDPAVTMRMERDITTGLPEWEGFVNGTGWENIRTSEIGNGRYPSLIGKSLAEIAEGWNCSPFQAATRLLDEAELAVSMIVHAMHDDDVTAIMQAPWRMGGTDALLGGKPHPRSYGSYPRVLGHYVRERGVITLEEGVRQMTGAAAKRLRLEDRGVIKVDAWADLVLFDPGRVLDLSTFEEPDRLPAGIAWVIVNGAPVLHERVATGNLPGHLLRQTSP